MTSDQVSAAYERLQAAIDDDSLCKDIDVLKATADRGQRIISFGRRFTFGFGVAKAIEDWFQAFDSADSEQPLLERIPRDETSNVAAKWLWFGFFTSLVGVLLSLLIAGVTAFFLHKQTNIFSEQTIVLAEQAANTSENNTNAQRTQYTQILFDEQCESKSDTQLNSTAEGISLAAVTCQPTHNHRIRTEAAHAFIKLERLVTVKPNLNGAQLGGTELSKLDLKNVSFAGANLINADISYSNFSGANLTGVNLNGANIIGANFTDTNLRGASLRGLHIFYFERENLIVKPFTSDGPGEYLPVFTGADLRGSDLRSSNIDGANFSGAVFGGFTTHLSPEGNTSMLSGTPADLTGATFNNANFSGAQLIGVKFSGVNLSGANLSDANLSDANLSDANLSFANLSFANLSDANLSDACGSEKTVLPDGFLLPNCEPNK